MALSPAFRRDRDDSPARNGVVLARRRHACIGVRMGTQY